MKSIVCKNEFHDLSKEKLKEINGGKIGNAWWWLFGFVFGGIEDFNSGMEAAKKTP